MPKPPLPPGKKKVPVQVKLPPWLAAWLRNQDESQAVIVERALVKQHKLRAPTDET